MRQSSFILKGVSRVILIVFQLSVENEVQRKHACLVGMSVVLTWSEPFLYVQSGAEWF